MSAESASDVRRFAGSVGVIIDRCLSKDYPVGSMFLIEEDKVATCGHLVALYAEHLPALKLKFPATGQEYGISRVQFHPHFDEKQSAQLARRAAASPDSPIALADFNIAVLTMAPEMPVLTDDLRMSVNGELSISPPPRDKGLSGNLADIEMPLVIQTITNARKEGTLMIADERNRPVARIYCRDGKILHANYGLLADDAAIYQIVGQNLAGNFFFQSNKPPDWAVGQPIARPTDMLLIESHRRLDELPKLLLELGGLATAFERLSDSLNVDALAAETRRDATTIWPFLTGTIALGELWRLARLDDYAIFSSVAELRRSGQIKEIPADNDPLNAYRARMLTTAPELPLAPFDPVEALQTDLFTGLPMQQGGRLLGTLRPGDPMHVLHNVDLPPDSSGCPIFKNGKVIGLHCGHLPSDTKGSGALDNLQQLVWIEALHECLEGRTGGDQRASTNIGCTEVARVDCPRCGSSSLDSARFCKSCGQQLIKDWSGQGSAAAKKRMAIIAALGALILGIVAFSAYSYLGHPSTPQVNARAANRRQAAATIELANPHKGSWDPQPASHVFQNGDLIRIAITVNDPGYIYALYQGTTSDAASLIFPDTPNNEKRQVEGSVIRIDGSDGSSKPGGPIAMQGLNVYGKPGSEKIVVMETSEKTTLLTDPEQVTKAFRTATQALDATPSESGIEVTGDSFGKGFFADPASAAKASVYITRQLLSHTK